MSEASFASLGPTLLARKGGAKPAMRPQLAPLVDPSAQLATLADEQLEDLGWNDMGQDEATEPRPSASLGAQIVPINPAAANEDGLDSPQASASPIVRRQQNRLAERVLAEAAMVAPHTDAAEPDDTPLDDEAAAPLGPLLDPMPSQNGRRAAFTLRLDADRHLKLRLASTMRGVSAQSLLTEALDTMLARIDDLDAIAERMKRH